jgi:SAM-dependent methyltransferase
MTFTPMPPQGTGVLFGVGATTTASATADASATVKAHSETAAAGSVAVASPMQMLPYPDCSFDLMTLHHVRHQKSMFDGIRRVLRPGGSAYFASFAIGLPSSPPHELPHGMFFCATLWTGTADILDVRTMKARLLFLLSLPSIYFYFM